MPRKILVVTGSPRMNGNTDLLADAFIEGAKSSDNKVYRFDAGKADIKGCMDCKYCFKNEGKCRQEDDMQEAYKLLRECDVLVFVSPICYFNFSAQMKAFIDRMYCGIPNPFATKSSALLTVQAGAELDGASNAIGAYKMIVGFSEWEDLGIITVPAVADAGAIKGNPKLDEAYELGAGIQ